MKAQCDLPPTWRREVRPREAAALIGCSEALVYKLLKRGRLRSRSLVTQGSRGIRLIDRADIETLLSNRGGRL
jgi:hypothetical protein